MGRLVKTLGYEVVGTRSQKRDGIGGGTVLGKGGLEELVLGDVYANARVLSEDYDSTGRIMKVRGLPGVIARPRRTLAAS